MAKKIKSKAVVKKVVMTDKGPSVSFGNFEFTTGQAEQLGDLAKSKEEVLITIEPTQDKLPGTV